MGCRREQWSWLEHVSRITFQLLEGILGINNNDLFSSFRTRHRGITAPECFQLTSVQLIVLCTRHRLRRRDILAHTRVPPALEVRLRRIGRAI
jgi:hypothetical protein